MDKSSKRYLQEFLACFQFTAPHIKNKYAPFYNCTCRKKCAVLKREVYGYENQGRAPRVPGSRCRIFDRRKVEAADPSQSEMRPWRFNELQRDLEGISPKVLTDSLRQMIDDGLACRHDYQEMPPRVEYGLTELGQKMLPILNALGDFGSYYKSILP